MIDMVLQVEGLFEGEDVVLLFLPLAHNFGRLVQHLGVASGFTIAFCPDASDVPRALSEVRPTLLPSVPRLYEKTYLGIHTAFAQAGRVQGRLIGWATAVGASAAGYRQTGRRYPTGLALRLALADRLVHSRVRARFGGRLRYAISGGAPLSKEIAEFFYSLGIVILEGYGLTECTSASHLNRPGRHRLGTVGLPFAGVEARIADDGEVLLRGDNVFAGYWGDEKATRELIAEGGWLRTGDVGWIDEDGFLSITDRKKDIIVTAGGKNVSPQNVENALKASRFISQALVIGDGRPYITALLTLDRDEVAKVAKTDGEIDALVEQAVAEVNRELGGVEQVKRFAVLERDFLTEAGELTPTLKLRRRACEEHFRIEIDRLYAGPESA
jgi:long-chain acyl-CoA synthetase